MDHSIAFYLPSKKSDGSKIGADRQKLIDATMKFLLIELGGATMREGTGYFLDAGIVHAEEVTICTSFCSAEKLEEQGWNINRLANSLAIEFEQISIAVEIDGEMFFYSPNESYRQRYDGLRAKWLIGDSDKYGFEKYIAADLEIPAV